MTILEAETLFSILDVLRDISYDIKKLRQEVEALSKENK